MKIPVLSVYDRKGNLIKEEYRDVELSLEAKKAIARYIYSLIKEEIKESINS